MKSHCGNGEAELWLNNQIKSSMNVPVDESKEGVEGMSLQE